MSDDLNSMAGNTLSRRELSAADLAREVATLGPRWSITGTDLRLALEGPMARTGKVAAQAGTLADELDHHPRIVLEYKGLELTIHTHDKKAITMLDLVFAARLERWLRTNGW